MNRFIMSKPLCRFFLPFIVAVVLTIFALYRIEGFSLNKIRGPLVSGTADLPPSESLAILRQPFHYLGKGRQCFVFQSLDRQVVIKFFNYSRFSLPSWFNIIPLPHNWEFWRKNFAQRRWSRFDATIESLELAWEYLQNETGLIYLHFQQGENLPILTIVDHANRTHHIDLNQTVFVLQKKATPIFEELENRYRIGGQAALNEGIKAFVSFLQKRCSLLIADDDRDVEINFGFYHDKILLLDPGRLFYDASLQHRQRVETELVIASKRLRKWLYKKYPESIAFLEQQITEASSLNL